MSEALLSADIANAFGRLAAASAAVLVALLFLRAALHKLADPMRFAGMVAAYRLTPSRADGRLVVALPALEAACAALLLFPSSLAPAATIAGAALAIGLLLLYAAAMGVALAQGRALIDCGCGGASEALSWRLVLRNLALAAAIAPAALGVGRIAGLAEAVVALAVGLVAALIWLAVEGLAANGARMRSPRRPGPFADLFADGATS